MSATLNYITILPIFDLFTKDRKENVHITNNVIKKTLKNIDNMLRASRLLGPSRL